MTWLKAIGEGLLVLFLACPALAGEPYIGVGGSLAVESAAAPPGVDVDNTRSGDVLLGYRYSPTLAFEAMGQLSEPFNVDSRNIAQDGSIETWSASLSAKVFPFEGRLQPFLAGGFEYMDVDSSSTVPGLDVDTQDWTLVLGGGVDFLLSNSFTLEMVGRFYLPYADLERFKFYTVGANLQYRWR